MKTKLLLVVPSLLFAITSFSQQRESCETAESDPVLDLNSITKCVVEKGKDKKSKKKVSFEVSSRKRVVRRKRSVATSTGIGNGFTQKISAVKKKTNLVNSLSLSKDTKNGVVSFHKVDQIPLFDDCKNVSLLGQEKCFRKQMSYHIQQNFQYPPEAYKKGTQGRVLVNFTIDKGGNTKINNILFPYQGEQLREEAKRIVKKLPQFIPGKHLGSNIGVQYSLQIKFKIPGVKRTNIRPKVNKVSNEKTYTFDELENVPVFETCQQTSDSSSDCFIKQLEKHVQENFAYPLDAINADIQGTVAISFVINKQGKVVDIKTKGPDNGEILEAAAQRLIEKLPNFKPALKDNVPVNTKYEFPIHFKLN